MSDLTLLDAQLPAHIAATFGAATNDDLSHGVNQSYPILSYRGKTWHVAEGDTRSLIAQPNGDPLLSIEVVILKANPNLSKIYYPDGYVEGSTDKPLCYSNDSIVPALDAQERQSVKCGVCPHNQWGSKITEQGAKGKACSDSRRLAVAPSGQFDRAMLLRVPAASLKELGAYAEGLNKRKVAYQALVTKVTFDHTLAYPKLVFSALRWLDADEATKVKAAMEMDVVEAITALNAPFAAGDSDSGMGDPLASLGPAPAHVEQVADPTPPKVTKPKAAQATVAEVAEIVQPAASIATGFGGSATVVEEPAPPPAAEVLAAGASSALDALLNEAFDD